MEHGPARYSPLRVLLSLPLLALALISSTATAEIYVVNSTATTSDAILGDGSCDDGTGVCTLHAAIEEANQDTALDIVEFGIPGAGMQTISLVGAPLPAVSQPIIIDGFTQSDASANDASNEINTVWRITLDGGGTAQDGLHFATASCQFVSPACRARGLVVQNFARAGIWLDLLGSIEVVGNQVASNGEFGILVESPDNVIGRTGADANLIVENAVGTPSPALGAGISIRGADNWVIGNYIGIAANGNSAAGNQRGIDIRGADATGNYIASNLISANEGSGIGITADDNRIVGNVIGTDVTTNIRRANLDGIRIDGGALNIIGGNRPANANVVSGNTASGIVIAGGDDNAIQGNLIGARKNSPLFRGNGFFGIEILSGNRNQIGGDDPDEGNLIVANTAGGVSVSGPVSGGAGRGNAIRSNRIFGNRPSDVNVIGIDLQPGFAVNPNDSSDSDEGGNRLQNFPEIEQIVRFTDRTLIAGVFTSRSGSPPSEIFALDFFSNTNCDATGFGQGEFYLGSAEILAGGGILTPFVFETLGPAPGTFFTATATDSEGNTSEFSECFAIDPSGDADLDLQIDPVTADAIAGTSVRYTLRLENLGPAAATAPSVAHALPAELLSLAATPTVGSYDGAVWQIPTLAVGGVAELVVDADIDVLAEGLVLVAASAEPGDEFDPQPVNDLAGLSLTVRNGVQLVLAGHAADDYGPLRGESVEFSLTVRNDGPLDAIGVVVTGQLPPELDFVGGPFGMTFDPATNVWRYALLGDIPNGTEVSFALQAHVPIDAEFGPAEHTAVVAAVNPLDDLTDNLRTAIVGVGGVADLKVEFVGSVYSNLTSELDWIVRNNGPETAPIGTFEMEVRTPGCDRVIWERPVPFPGSGGWPLGAADISGSTACGWGVRIVRSDFYDPIPENDYFQESPPQFNLRCGLGVELAVLLPGLMWLQGRRRRRSARRPGSRVLASGALAAVFFGVITLAAGGAHATPVVFSVDTPASSASVQTTSPYPSDVQQTNLSGGGALEVVLTDHVLFGTLVTQIAAGDLGLGFSDVVLTLDSPAGVEIAVSGVGVGGTLSIPERSGLAAAPGTTLIDFGGSVLTLDSGLLLATGSVLGGSLDVEIDLTDMPLAIGLGENSVGTATAASGPEGIDLAITLPLVLDWTLFQAGQGSPLFPDGFDIAIALSGAIVLDGTLAVPEPGAAQLIAVGSLLLGWVRRSHRNQPADHRVCSAA